MSKLGQNVFSSYIQDNAEAATKVCSKVNGGYEGGGGCRVSLILHEECWQGRNKQIVHK